MQNTRINTQYNGLTIHPHNIKCEDDNNLCLITPSIYTMGQDVTVSHFEFSKRLMKKIGMFIDDDFKWDNILIAGGLISGLMEKNYNESEYSLSDVDIFVYGEQKEVVNKIQEIYDYFVKKLNKKFYAFVYEPGTPIVSIIIPGHIAFQIIGTKFKNPQEVLNSFDLTHCQVGFDGTNVVCTDEYINAVKTRITKITKRSIYAYRLVKTYRRGYSIRNPEYCYIKNIFHQYTTPLEGQRFPANTDKFYDIHNLQNIIDELANNEIVIKNLTKNYIPDEDNNNSVEEEMHKIGTLYAGENKYRFVNDNNNNIFIENIKKFLGFVRTPFLC